MRPPAGAADAPNTPKRQKVAGGHEEAPFRVVNVFTNATYGGNPTCVCFAPAGVSDEWRRRVAIETAQPTTSFVHIDATRGILAYRTFSPTGDELPILSGHSSLGVAAATMAHFAEQRSTSPPDALTFSTRFGDVSMVRDDEFIELSLPSGTGAAVASADAGPLRRALGVPDEASLLNHGSVLGGKFLFCEVTPHAFAALAPDVAAIRAMPGIVGVFATAKGMPQPHTACTEPTTVDFSVRNFVPSLGIDEDVATGSIQAFLYPYWAYKLGKAPGAPLYAWQNSRRGGLIRSRQRVGDSAHVLVAGGCALSLRGSAPL